MSIHTINISGINGSTGGSVGDFNLTGITLDWRGGNLFDDPTILANNLTVSDFSFTRIAFEYYDSLDNREQVIDNNATRINFSSGNPPASVPEPASFWLFMLAALGLFARSKAKV